MKLQGNAVLILPDKNPEKSEGGVLIPTTVKSLQKTGKVIDVGPTCKDIEIGDKVYYNTKVVSLITYKDVEYHFGTELNITYKFKD